MNARAVLPVALAAVLFGLSAPLSKLLLKDIPPVALAGLLYLGAFAGLALYAVVRRVLGGRRAGGDERPLRRADLPWLAGAIVSGGIAGPILLMTGLERTTGIAASLLLNLEGIATALIAVQLFREPAGHRTWAAATTMALAGTLAAWDPARGRFEALGPILVLAAMFCWGLDNNLTRNISDKDPVLIAGLKGLAAGGISLGLSRLFGEGPFSIPAVPLALAVGALCYGLSLVLFIVSLRGLGALRTGTLFGLAPFAGAAASIPMLGEPLAWTMAPAAGLMVLGYVLVVGEKHAHAHGHARMTHVHRHAHRDLHHEHAHSACVREPHCHEHTHEETHHVHGHWPDIHHRHGHGGA
jgi:drug/metabolite transporter (DMT)-like permease